MRKQKMKLNLSPVNKMTDVYLSARVPVETNLVEIFDKILTDLCMSYVKTYWRSSIPPNYIQFCILFYRENEKIISFLTEYNINYKVFSITEEQFNLFQDFAIKW